MLCLLAAGNLLTSANIVMAATNGNTQKTYQASMAHHSIELRSLKQPTKKIKINNVAPLPPIVRPSIRGKAFQRQQYNKAAQHHSAKWSPLIRPLPNRVCVRSCVILFDIINVFTLSMLKPFDCWR